MAYQPKSYRKFVATAATATLVASAFAPFASAHEFKDVEEKYNGAVDFLVSKGVTGYTDGTFKTQKTITRLEAAEMLAKALGLTEVKDAPASGFTDVPARVATLINAFKAEGITQGITETTFGSNDLITRGQLAIWIQKAYDLKAKEGSSNKFTDVADRYKEAVQALVDTEITQGATETTFGTTDNAKRGDFALFVKRAHDAANPPVANEVVVETASATDASTVVLSLKNAVTKEAFKDVTIQGEGTREVGEITVSEDGKTVTLSKVAPAFEDGKEYVVNIGEKTLDHSGFKYEAPVTELKVESVSAINATTVEVKLNGALSSDVDFNSFELNGDIVVTDVKLSSDRKTATLTTNRELTRNQEYTLALLDKEGEQISNGKFTWEVAEGITVALEKTDLSQGESTGLTVTDESGKLVSNAKVQVTSYNENIVKVTNPTGAPGSVKLTAQDVAGTVDIEVVTELPDGSKLINTFKVTVKEATITVANKGYSLLQGADGKATSISDQTDAYAYDNTAAFAKYAEAKTSIVQGTTANLVAFQEKNGDPEVEEISFEEATVKSSNAIVASAVIDETTDELIVTANSPGSSTITATLKDGTKKTFAIKVTAAPTLTTIGVDATAVKLSDESKDAAGDAYAAGDLGIDGVNSQVIEVDALDQFGEEIVFGSTGKVTVSSSTDGITLTKATATEGTYAALDTGNVLDFAEGTTAEFRINAIQGKTVSNAKVTVNYFEKATDLKPKATKTITVNVVDVDSTKATANIDVALDKATIEANAKNPGNLTDVASIDFTSADALEVFELDAKGNRVGVVDVTSNVGATLATTSLAETKVTLADDELGFAKLNAGEDVTAQQDALTYLRTNGAVTVNVAATVTNPGGETTAEIVKPVKVEFKNSAAVPNAATVATAPLNIKLPVTADPSVKEITFNQILFGTIDETSTDLIKDVNSKTNKTAIVGAKKTAKNGGYAYSKPLVTVKDQFGKELPIGLGLYGTDTYSLVNGNVWNNDFTTALNTVDFASGDFTVVYEIANQVKSDGATVTIDSEDLDASKVELTTKDDYATFTLVVREIYVTGAKNTTAAEKKANNLLANPVQVNVSVSGK